MMGAFDGQVAVVTGAGGGIGRALAGALLDAGARVALLDIDVDALQRASEGLPADRHLCVGCDVRDSAACTAAIDRVVQAWGGIDVLINNAGLSHRSLVADTDPQVMQRVMDVNFFGAVHCTQAALGSVKERRGTIVALSSVAGFAPLVGRAGYAASKHALHGFFDSLRSEVAGDGVQVLLVCPSFTRTGINDHALAGDGSFARAGKRAVGRVAEPHEVATAILLGIQRRQRRLVLSPVGKASWWLSRLLPGVYERIMLSAQGAEFLDRRPR